MAKGNFDIDKVKVVTPKGRVSFPNVFQPRAVKEGDPKKFSITLLFDKKTDLTPLKKAIHNAVVAAWGPDKAKWPKNWHNPIADGDDKSDLDGYAGCWTINANAKAEKRPAVVDASKNAILDPSEFYAGCYARASVIACSYEYMGKKGIKFNLQGVQKLGEGKPFGRAAENDFDAVEDGSDDESNYASGEDDESMYA